ncbi:MAG: hypothetical protein PHF68_03835 [Candidatus ainarchaeum sp.]|nr:hypothetical protein [Candidatus ainarchaeum sp.]
MIFNKFVLWFFLAFAIIIVFSIIAVSIFFIYKNANKSKNLELKDKKQKIQLDPLLIFIISLLVCAPFLVPIVLIFGKYLFYLIVFLIICIGLYSAGIYLLRIINKENNFWDYIFLILIIILEIIIVYFGYFRNAI